MYTVIGFYLTSSAYWQLKKLAGIDTFAYHKQDGNVYIYSKVYDGDVTPPDDDIREEWEKFVETLPRLFDDETFGVHKVRKVFFRVKDRMLAREEFSHLKPTKIVDIENIAKTFTEIKIATKKTETPEDGTCSA